MIPELSPVFLSQLSVELGGGISEGYFTQSFLLVYMLEMHRDGLVCQRRYV